MEMTLVYEPFASLSRLLAPSGTAMPSFVPAADVVVTDEDLTVTMDVPGFKVDDLSIELEGDILAVRGERTLATATSEDGDDRVCERRERGFGRFERLLRVPRGLDPDAITASLADGVLTVRIPMPESRKPRRIEIGTDGARPALEQGSSHDAGDEREPVDSVA
jgi:HSP20 family protein